MQTATAASRASRILTVLLLAAVAAGCASAPQKNPAPAAGLSREDAASALLAGTEGVAAFRREHIEARCAGRAPDYGASLGEVARALSVLRSTLGSAPLPEFERAALALESAKEGMDRVDASARGGDAEGEEVGWEIFDRSVASLHLALAPGGSVSSGDRRR
jgi:hypothetical protein